MSTRINWTKFCKEIADANGIEILNVTYLKNGEIKTGRASRKQIDMFPRFGIELLSINN